MLKEFEKSKHEEKDAVNAEIKELRVRLIQDAVAGMDNVEVCSYTGLTVEFCHDKGIVVTPPLRREGSLIVPFVAQNEDIAPANLQVGQIRPT